MSRLFGVAFTLVLLSSIAANVVLMRTNKQLITTLNNKTTIPLGVSLPPLEGEDVSGHPIKVPADNSGSPTVLFVFSPICHYCASNWPNWALILSGVHQNWRPVFVNAGIPSTPAFRKSHGLESYIILDKIYPQTQLAYRLSATPETIILNGQGKAVRMWVGELPQNVVAGFSRTLSAIH